MFTYDMLEPVADLNASLTRLTEVFAPLHAESWSKEKSLAHPGKAYDMNVGVFANMWFSRALRIFIAYKDGKADGYLVGMLFRPLTHQSQVFQVEDWYTRSPDTVAGLFDYAQQALRFIGIDELWLLHGEHDYTPTLGDQWKHKGRAVIDKYGNTRL